MVARVMLSLCLYGFEITAAFGAGDAGIYIYVYTSVQWVNPIYWGCWASTCNWGPCPLGRDQRVGQECGALCCSKMTVWVSTVVSASGRRHTACHRFDKCNCITGFFTTDYYLHSRDVTDLLTGCQSVI